MLPFKISKTQVILQDVKNIDLDDVTEVKNDSIFSIDPIPVRSYEKDDLVQMDISIEMNVDYTTLARHGYTTLDFFSDIGGIQSISMSFIGVFLSMWNYSQLDNFLVSKLYRPGHMLDSDLLSVNYYSCSNILQFCVERILPRKLACCTKKRKFEAL